MPPKLVMAAFLKNKIKFGPNSIEQNIHFHSGVWNSAQYSYSIIKKKKKIIYSTMYFKISKWS